MFGGMQGAGAEDAWYGTSLEVEHAVLFHIPMVGAVVDLMKYFDKIMQTSLYCILSIAELSHGILLAHAQFQVSLIIHHTIAD